MAKSYISSLLFALLTSVSVAVAAAPAPAKPGDAASPISSAVEAAQTAKININTASAESMQMELSGIGASKAIAIVAYREENGAFTSVDELIEVKGIGKALLNKNRHKLAVD